MEFVKKRWLLGRRSGKLKVIAALIRAGDYSVAKQQFSRWFFSDSLFYGLRRDLTVPFDAPIAKIPFTVREMEKDDIPALLNPRAPGLTGSGIYERLLRLQFVETGIRTCYVAVTSEGVPCYMQGLIGHHEDAKLQAHFPRMFPSLAPDEALLEHALTPEKFQGLGIMSSAMAQIAEKGRDLGARWVITFVRADNIASLKGCKRAGFSPYLSRRERWQLFQKQVSFEELPTGASYPFETQQAAA